MIMKTFSPLLLLGALGVLSSAFGTATAAVDTSQWKCETCPFEKGGVTATLEVGVSVLSDKSSRFGDYTGLDRKGGALLAGGSVRQRSVDGWYADVDASDLGLDARSLTAEAGRAGQFALKFGYGEIPRHFSDTAMTPFLGAGSTALTLPAGFPAATTAAMPLASALHPVDLNYKRSRTDLGASYRGLDGWIFDLQTRHTVRDGTQRGSGAFFVNASQLVLPLDQQTDDVVASATYASRSLQASLAYNGSVFQNGQLALSWTNPFTAGIIGGSQGQLALAPDNQFHQLQASIGAQLGAQTLSLIHI